MESMKNGGLMTLIFPILLYFLISSSLVSSEKKSQLSEAPALITLKSSFIDSGNVLSSWINTSNPCDSQHLWSGVVCFDGVVSGLRLGGMNLSGEIDVDALSLLGGLRTVSFVSNAFSGEIPNFSKLRNLKAIYLSNNRFRGSIPEGFLSGMTHLKKLWLSGNSFSGNIPSSIGNMTALLELHLEMNEFTGTIPDVYLPQLKSLNVSNNKLGGEIPVRFAVFDASSFQGNEGLCGPPVGSCGSSTSSKDISSGRTAVVAAVLFTVTLALVAFIVIVKGRKHEPFDTADVGNSNNDDLNAIEAQTLPTSRSSHSRGKGSSTRNYRHSGNQSSRSPDSSKKGTSKSGSTGDLVMVNDEKGSFALPDLMRAAAEVLGSGSLGSAYKAVLTNGMSVVVKRVREFNRLTGNHFAKEMQKLGGVRHPNILTPIAYHYRKEETLLVFEYIDKGSLLFILHADRGPYHAALDWPTRLRIIQGVTLGLAHLHQQFPNSEVPHGDLKSSNILLGQNFKPIIVDYGYIPFIQESQASTSMMAYRSPEFIHYRNVSPKSDIYCLSLVILEILTGKFPTQYYLNNGKGGMDVVQWATAAVEERKEGELLDPEIVAGCGPEEVKRMERMVRLGVELADVNPEKRPSIAEVLKRVEDISGGDLSERDRSSEELSSTEILRRRSSSRRESDDHEFNFGIS